MGSYHSFYSAKKKMEARFKRSHKSDVNAEGYDGYDWHEKQPKWPVTRIVDVAFAVISILVWTIILLRIFSGGNADFEKMILLNEKAADVYPLAQREVVRLHPSTAGQEDGAVMIYYPVYLDEVKNLQFTARVRRRALPPGKGETGYTFILRESTAEKNVYHELSYHTMEKNISYTFFRLCFEGVELEEDSVCTFLVFEGGYAPKDGEDPYPVTDSKFRFTVCNSDTYRNRTVPKQKYYQRTDEAE